MKRYIVFSDSNLGSYFKDLFSQIVWVRHIFDEWDLEVQARGELSIELLKSMDKGSVFFAHNYDKAQVLNSTDQPSWSSVPEEPSFANSSNHLLI